ncbi:MAG TPA: DUF417 family protein [Archangium sp.]|nr:DUF417 family protein [Archangium sp.]
MESARPPLVRSRLPSVRAGELMVRYSLALLFAWLGLLKFREAEAERIQALVEPSPLVSWVYDIFTVRAFSGVLGLCELAFALLLALRPWSPRAAFMGGLGVVVASFLSFLLQVFRLEIWFAPGAGLFVTLLVLASSVWLTLEAREAPRRRAIRRTGRAEATAVGMRHVHS